MVSDHKQDSSIITKELKVVGMTCAACAISLESYLKPLNGVNNVSVNYPNQSISIDLDLNKIGLNILQKKANEIGYNILIGDKQASQKQFEELEEKRLSQLKFRLILSVVFSFPVFVISMFLMGVIPYENWVMMGLSVPVLFWFGSEFFLIAWKKLKKLSANMDTLVALSTGTSFLFSVGNTVYPSFFLSKGIQPHVYYESAVIIITLILLGRYLEEKAKSKTSSAIKELMDLKPKFVTVIRNGEEESISIDEIIKGELILIKPGDKIPVDGKVKKGESYIDESMITGEPLPTNKTKGSRVFAGTINQKGSLKILATEIGSSTLLSQIIELVKKAQSSKPAVQKLADKIAGIFVPIVLGISLFTFAIWLKYGPEPPLTYAMLSFVTVLIIACPCALGLATPTALMVGIGKGAQQGILIKDAQALETAYKSNILIVDKTGTLTEGKPEVSDFIKSKNYSTKLDQILLSIESQSEHPIAQSIVKYLKNENIDSISIESFKSHTGLGASASFENIEYFVGNNRLMDLNGLEIPPELTEKWKALRSQGKTIVFVSSNKMVEAVIAVTDKVKKSAYESIRQIQKLGIDVYMLTGDNEQTAALVTKTLGIKNFKANMLPSDKGDFIKKLQDEGNIVAMAGDGINDSYALAQADVGIAMGSGTDVAIESAAITLIHSDLNQMTRSFTLSKFTMRTIKQNLFWAFIYNIVAIPIAAGVLYPFYGFLLNPMIAGAAMSMSSLSVLANSLRLKKLSLN